MEADFRHLFGLDLSDMWTGALSMRRVRVLAEQILWMDSVTARRIAHEEGDDDGSSSR